MQVTAGREITKISSVLHHDKEKLFNTDQAKLDFPSAYQDAELKIFLYNHTTGLARP